ncbi:MAG: GTP 3',8-cyclase MoaA [bacterium]
MTDNYGREIDSIKISVTQRCNLDCPYCHKEGEFNNTGGEISLTEIGKMITAAKEFKFKKIKITGGEPLLRNDIIEIIKIIKKIGFEDISLVTNGFFLGQYAGQLSEAGLDRVNIGCDSPSFNSLPKNTKNITAGLNAAVAAGLFPVKLNMVVLKNVNDGEIDSMIEFARRNDAILQLIELINTDNDYYKKYHCDLEPIEKNLERKAEKIIEKKDNGRKQYDLGDVLIEVVRPTGKSFCKNCRKLRITSDGKLKPCLMLNDTRIEFKDRSSFIEAVNRRVVFNDRHN